MSSIGCQHLSWKKYVRFSSGVWFSNKFDRCVRISIVNIKVGNVSNVSSHNQRMHRLVLQYKRAVNPLKKKFIWEKIIELEKANREVEGR